MKCFTCQTKMECYDDATSELLRADWLECPLCHSRAEIIYGNGGEYITNVKWERAKLKKDEKQEEPSESKEKLVEEGTVVMVKKDKTFTLRRIKRSFPNNAFCHQYVVDGWPEVCELNDLIVYQGIITEVDK